MAKSKGRVAAKKSAKALPKPGNAPLTRQERRWRAEEAASTLIRAQEVKGDRRLFNDAKQILKEKAAAAQRAVKSIK